MLTLANFIAAFIVSWVVVYAIYGVTLLAVRSVWRMVRAVARLGEAVLSRSHTDGVLAPVVPSTAGTSDDVLNPAC